MAFVRENHSIAVIIEPLQFWRKQFESYFEQWLFNSSNIIGFKYMSEIDYYRHSDIQLSPAPFQDLAASFTLKANRNPTYYLSVGIVKFKL